MKGPDMASRVPCSFLKRSAWAMVAPKRDSSRAFFQWNEVSVASAFWLSVGGRIAPSWPNANVATHKRIKGEYLGGNIRPLKLRRVDSRPVSDDAEYFFRHALITP